MRGAVVLCLGVAMTCWLGCGKKPASEEPQAPDTPAAKTQTPAAPAEQPKTARGVLEAMVGVYKKCTSYADAGTVRLQASGGDQKIDQSVDFSVTMVRPNKIRLQVYQGMLVSDGKEIRAAVLNLPDQVLLRKTPEKLTIQTVYFDEMLSAAITQGFAGPSPQLVLLLADDPLKAFLHGADEPELAEPGKLGERDYYRIKINRPDGSSVFWIDQETFVLRRIELPTDEFRRMLGGQAKLDSISLEADFAGVQLNGQIESKAFRFEMPEGAEIVKFFMPPHPAQLLAKPVPDFTFESLDGKLVTPKSLAGKIVVMDFWASWCGPCRMSLPNLQKVYEQYKDNDKLTFLTVNVDRPDVPNKKLTDMFGQLKVTVPIVRDMQQLSMGFKITGIPTLFILGPDGLVQDYEIGGNPALTTALAGKLEKLLAGENIYEKPLRQYQDQLKRREAAIERDAESGEGPTTESQEIPRAEIAPQSEPKTFKLKPLWKCTELKTAGNILIVPAADGSPRAMVVDTWKSVAEIDTQGKVLATHKLEIPDQEAISFLRTAVGADGKRYYAGSAPGMQQFHLFDQDWKPLLSYPKDAQDNPHAGITDVQMGDLDGDGTPELFVGYRGIVGVQGLSLDGQRVWANRSIETVLRLAIDGPNEKKQRNLLSASSRGALAVFDSKGQRGADISVPNRMVLWIAAADLDGDGKPELSGLAPLELGTNIFLGFDRQGKELWSHNLPTGIHEQPVEPITPGNISASGPGQWLVVAADGSIHIIAADGKLIDRFDYGAAIGGLATLNLAGRPVLLVSSTNGLEAWQIEKKGDRRAY